MRTLLPAFFAIFTILSGCDDRNSGLVAASHNLRKGMTEQEAINAMQTQPTNVNMLTCGSTTPNPFSCKALTYVSPFVPFLSVNDPAVYIFLEQSPDGIWRVNSWNVV